jgi:hypothetical protein
MSAAVSPPPTTGAGVGPIRNLADLYRRLGGVPLHRIRFHPRRGPPRSKT